MRITNEQMEVLVAYSQGQIGWRAAGRQLDVVDHHEILALLQAHNLPLPAEDDEQLPPETAERLTAFFNPENSDER